MFLSPWRDNGISLWTSHLLQRQKRASVGTVFSYQGRISWLHCHALLSGPRFPLAPHSPLRPLSSCLARTAARSDRSR